MELGAALLAVSAGEYAERFEEFRHAIEPAWVTAALAARKPGRVRRRKLPGELVVWLVIAMALFRDRAIAAVVRHLDLVVSPPTGGRGRVTNAAIVQARDTLGPEPLAALFRQLATAWAGGAADAERWRGLAVYGVDGTTLRLPDTAANDAAFGRPGTSRGNATAGYPQLRLVVLLVLRQHVLAAAAFGPYRTSELALAARLWGELPAHALVILDRGFAAYPLFHQLGDRSVDRHWLVRARSGPTALAWRVVQRLGRGDDLVELTPSRATCAAHPELPTTLRARAIRVQHRGYPAYVVLTSLLDPAAYPAADLAALYHERWEVELAFDEVKTHTCERVEALRSKAPARIEQEVWGLLIAYTLVRFIVARAAQRAKVPPLSLSYRHALLVVRSFCLSAWMVAPGTIPRALDRLLDDLALVVLPPRRCRRYPRAVKIKMSNYPRKRPDRQRPPKSRRLK